MIIPIRLIATGLDKALTLFVNAPGSNRQKSIFMSILLYAFLLLLLFFIRFWPPSNLEELVGGGGGGGVTVNFGDTEFGKGAEFTSKELDVKQPTKQAPVAPTLDENIITEDTDEDVVSVVKNEPKKKTQIVIKKDVTKPVAVVKPVVRKTDDALANILKGNKKGGDGNSSTSGNQGRANGDINSNGYSGTGGSGGGSGGGNGTGNGTGTGVGSGSGTGGGSGSGNGKGVGAGYSLNGRKALSIPKPSYNCDEEGTVVVQITVDKNGRTIDAKPGYRGTTNTASCLASQAKAAALSAKWDESPTGAEKQVGTITYNFKIRN